MPCGMRMRPRTGWWRMPKPEVMRAYGIGMRMKGRLSERPSAVKYSGLPSRTKRNALLSLPSTVKVAASTGPGAGQLAVAPGLVDDHAEAVVFGPGRVRNRCRT